MFFVTVCQAVCCHAIMTYTADNSAKSLNTSGDPRPVTLYITTIDGEEPTFEIVYPPEGGTGVGICNRTKVMGRMVMTTGTDTLYDSGEWAEGASGMSIKVRGNTSAASAKEQLPYKIKLVKKADLLMRGSKVYKHKDWVLLRGTWHSKVFANQQTCILPLVGTEVSRATGAEWAPEGNFVQVYLNGKYRGIYYLIEAIARGDGRIQVDDSGFIAENDAYWWNADGAYFKTSRQESSMGWTFKYPDLDDITDEQRDEIANCIEAFEDSLYNNRPLDSIADLHSFARWVLAHDYLGTKDAWGSNMYMYRQNLDPLHPETSKLKMATPWDFDSSFTTPDDEWSVPHYAICFYYNRLFTRPDFVQAYVDVWNEVHNSIYTEVANRLHAFEQRNTTAFETIRLTCYAQQNINLQVQNSLHTQVEETLQHLATRVATVDSLMAYYTWWLTGVTDCPTSAPVTSRAIYNTTGQKVTTTTPLHQLPAGVYIEVGSDGRARKVIKK